MSVDFSQFDEEFKPEDPFGGARAEDLTDGDYEFRIQDVKQKEAKGKAIIELKLEVMTEGQHLGHVITESIWLDPKEIDTAKRFGAVLKKFGFDTDCWKPSFGRSFSKEMPKALPWLKGMRVKAKKVTTVAPPKFAKDTEKTYHNINWRGRSDVDDGLPRKIGVEQLNATAPHVEEEVDPFAESA